MLSLVSFVAFLIDSTSRRRLGDCTGFQYKIAIDFQLSLLSWKSNNLVLPMYLSELFLQSTFHGDHKLSVYRLELIVSLISTKLGEQTLSSAAPRLKNSLPIHVLSALSINLIKIRQQMFSFQQAYERLGVTNVPVL